MRLSGVTETARGFGPHDHLCWVYDEPREFRSRAREFLADGLAQGQRAWCLADSDAAVWWEELQDLDNAARRPDSVQVESLDGRYAAAVDPIGQVRAFATLMQEALAAGFTGLRVVAESTLRLRTPEQLNAWACCEFLADRYMMTLPFSALCAYNRAELSKETIAHVACLHPTVNGDAAPFRLYSSCGAAVTLSGELDLTSCDLFAAALQRADLRPVDGELIIDATAVLRTGSTSSAPRMIEILGVREVRVELSP